jgi:hypothetical protein
MRLVLLVLAAAAAAAMGCGPIATDIPSSKEIDVPGTGIGNPNPLAPDVAFPADVIGQALAQSIQQSFDTSGYDKSHVSSLTLTKLKLTVTNPEEQPAGHQLKDLSFLQKLTVFIGSDDKIKVAESGDGDFTKGLLDYDVPVTKAELADAFKASDSLDMSSDVQVGDPPRFDTKVNCDSNVHVELSVF